MKLLHCRVVGLFLLRKSLGVLRLEVFHCGSVIFLHLSDPSLEVLYLTVRIGERLGQLFLQTGDFSLKSLYLIHELSFAFGSVPLRFLQLELSILDCSL
jgi:hypothetical protein